MVRIVAGIAAFLVTVSLARLLLATGGSGSFPVPLSVTELASAPAGGWVWFQDPRAVQYAGYLYVGAILDTGDVQVRVFDDATGAAVSTVTLHAALQADDHDNPSLYIRPSDHKLVTMYSRHLADEVLERISTTSLDTDPDLSDGFASEVSFDLDEDPADLFFTYPNTVGTTNADGVADDLLWVFVRVHMGGTDAEWHYLNSDDGGATFSGLTRLHDVTYSRIVSDADTIHVAAGEYPGEDSSKIYHLYRENAAWRQSDGTDMGAGLPFDESDMTVVYDSGGDKLWVWDIALDGTGRPYITFVRFVSTSDHRAYYARWTGAAWDVHEIAAAGGTMVDDLTIDANQIYYAGGVVLDHADPSIIYISREVSGQFEMFRYATTDGGSSWMVTQLTEDSAVKHVRPAPVRDADHIPVVWLTGDYQDYTDYSLGITGFIP